nr:nascent polypeptide-associated complex subunit alpha, muscle-specific form-like [Aegilops tauschii subsp. strangulata]
MSSSTPAARTPTAPVSLRLAPHLPSARSSSNAPASPTPAALTATQGRPSRVSPGFSPPTTTPQATPASPRDRGAPRPLHRPPALWPALSGHAVSPRSGHGRRRRATRRRPSPPGHGALSGGLAPDARLRPAPERPLTRAPVSAQRPIGPLGQ